MTDKSLYERLGGYDGIAAFVNFLLPRLAKEQQLLIDYLCSNAGGALYYSGRDMKLSHKGMAISESDWSVFLGHAGDTMSVLSVPTQECEDVTAFVLSLKDDIVEV